MKYSIACLLIFTLFSCKKEEKKELRIPKKEIQVNAENNEDTLEVPDTLKISYDEHKNLFDIITILPDSTFSSWEWPKSDRIEFVKKVKKNNYIATTSRFMWKFALIAPNTLQIQIVDGAWVLSIYKIKPNNYIVITDDIVGDGNDFHAFEYENGQLTNIPFRDLFDHFITALVIDPNDEKCMEIFDDNRILFEYSYIGTKKIKMSNSYLDENKDCFKGNTLNYEFNPLIKKFNLIKID
ncbi:hypothetical protein [Flavobacterium sp. HJSW_4]|uniref:hypothetical protein n=1 Tax=Flavobacterium sp. HJSW_4 TaxID=3344660 RepID=UPI0035F2A6E1